MTAFVQGCGRWPQLCDRNGSELKKPIRVHTDIITSISFSPDGQTIASGSRDRTVKLWTREGKSLKEFDRQSDAIIGVNFSSDGEVVIVADERGTVKRFKRNGEQLSAVRYGTAFKSVSFSPDGRIIASTKGDNTVQLWSAEGEKLGTLYGHEDEILIVRFSPDGKILASASADTSVVLWHLDVVKLINLLDKSVDQLMIDACVSLKGYIQNTEQGNRHLCDHVSPG
jgi:WD40 repeat protein